MVRAVPLTSERLGSLPDPCRSCVRWELGAPAPWARDHGAEEDEVRKQAWVATQAFDAGAPGRVVVRDGTVVAWVVFAPTGAFAARSTAPTASTDALLLASLWVHPDDRGRHLGRLLVQAAVKEAVQRDLAAVEAYGDRRFEERRCALPLSWLEASGFVVSVDHPHRPLLRLSTGRTVRWTEALGQAVDGLVDRLPRPVAAPTADGAGRR